MRDGQGCLLPILGCPHRHLLRGDDRPNMIAWCSSKSGTADTVPALPDGNEERTIWSECRVGRHGKRQKCKQHRSEKKRKIVVDLTETCSEMPDCPNEEDASDCPNEEDASDRQHQEDTCETGDTSFLPGLDDETALRCLAFVSRSDYGNLACVSKTYLNLVRSPLLYQLRRRYGVVEQWVYMYASGKRGWTALDPKRRLWMDVPPTNANPSFDLSDRESLSAGTHLLWLGKEIFDFVVYRYDLITNGWGRGPAMNTPRCLFASASCGEFAFVAGGFSQGALNVLRSAERYDSQSGIWDHLPDMNIPRHKCSGCYMDGKFYVIGGKDASHEPITSGEEYDPVTKKWRIILNMYPTPRIQRRAAEPSPPLVAVVDNQLYAIENSINSVKVYDKGANTWRLLGQVPVRADFHNGWGLAFKALGDELFVIGGYRDPPRQDGIAVFSWRPGPEGAPPDWKLVTRRFQGTGNFLYNCAVMAC